MLLLSNCSGCIVAAGREELQAAAEAAAKRERQQAQASSEDTDKMRELRRNLQESLAR